MMLDNNLECDIIKIQKECYLIEGWPVYLIVKNDRFLG